MKTKVTVIVNHENWSANTYIMDTLGQFIDECNADSDNMEGWSMQITEIEELADEEETTSPKVKMPKFQTTIEKVTHYLIEVEAPNIAEAERLFGEEAGTVLDVQVTYNNTDIEEVKD